MAKSKLDWDAIDKRAKKRDKEDYIKNLYAEAADRDYLTQKAYNEGRSLSNDFVTRTSNLQNALYNELNSNSDLVKSSYGSDTYNMLLQDSKKMRDAEYNKYYSNYMNTTDYQNSTYDEKQKYLTDEYKDANKEKRNSFLKSALSFLASISPTGDMSADIAQQQAEDFREQARQEMDKAKQSKKEANSYDQYRIDLYNEQYTKKNLEILNKDKELKNLVADLASKKAQQDIYTVSPDDGLASYVFADKVIGEYNSAYNAISKKGYSDEEINSLLDTYTREQNRISAEDQEEKNKDFANEHPVLASTGYVAANVFQAAAVPEILQQGISNAFNDEYKPIDTNSQGFAFTRFRNTTSKTVSENIEREMQEKTNSEFWGHAASFAYQTGLSIGDFASVAVLPEPVSLAIMGTTSGVSAVKDATDRGISADKALLTGLAAGVSEIFFEKFSLENFNALKTSNKNGVKEFVKDIMKQSFTEGSEEVFTDISNAISDQLINSDKSELNQQYNALLKKYDGDKDKAWKALSKHFGLQLAESFAGGALSGGVMGSAAKGINTVNVSRLGKDIQSEKSEYGSLSALIKTANNIQDDAINKPLKKVVSNENPTNADIGRLYFQVENSVDKKFENAKSLDELEDTYNSVSQGIDGAMLSNITAQYKSYVKNFNDVQNVKTDVSTASDNSAENNAVLENDNSSDNDIRTQLDEAKTIFNFENIKGSVSFNLPVSSTKNGNNIELTSVADNTGENVYFNTKSGKRISLDEIDFPDNDIKKVVLDAVNTYQTAGASAYIKNAPDASLTSKAYIDYNNNAQIYYNLGASGVEWSSVSNNPNLKFSINKLGTDVAKQFFDAGHTDTFVDTKAKNKIQKTDTVKTKRTKGKYTNKTDNAQLDEVFTKLADKLHIDITYQNGSKDSNGSFVASKGQAVINEGAKRGDMTTAMHECIGEYMRAYSPTEYKQLSDSLINWLASEYPELTQKDIIKYYNTYLRTEALTTMQDARFEMTNDLIGALFASEDGLTDFCQWLETDKNTSVQEKKTVLEKLKEIIQKAVERLKEYFNKEKFTDTQKAVSEMELKQAQQFRQQCLDILDNAISNLENGVEISNSVKYSIREIVGKNGNYGIGVYLDTDIFNNVKPRDWGKTLNRYVNNNLAGEQVIVTDENGNAETIEFAGKKERVKKDGAENSRKVIDKLARKKGMHEQLAVAHAIELISVSEKENRYSNDNSHQWLDENGWEHRTIYLQNKVNKKIYSAELNIANTKDGRKILYDINKIKEVDDGAVASKGSHITSTSKNSIYKKSKDVKKFSRDVDFEYDTLIKKSDMKITVINDDVTYTPNSQTRKTIINNAIDNAKEVGLENSNGNAAVYVDDIEQNIILSKKAIKHSLDRRLNVNAPVVQNIGNILKNAIKINELSSRDADTIEKSYVLMGIAKNQNNEPYVVSFVVNKYTNELTSMNVLYAVNAKKEPTGSSKSPQVSTPATGSSISISDLLDYVNKYFPDILPESVLKHYGHNSRPDGVLGESALYSLDIDELFDEIEHLNYNNHLKKLGKTEYNRLEHEARRWKNKENNKLYHLTLDNGYRYYYFFDEDYEIRVVGKHKSINIHEVEENVNTNSKGFSKRFNNAGSEYRNNISSFVSTSRGKSNRNILSTDKKNIQEKRRSDRTGLSENSNSDSRQSIDIEDYDTESMIKAFSGGLHSTQSYINERVKAKVDAGVSQDNAQKGIKQAIAKEYKQKYIDGNANTKAGIITIMTNTGLYGNRSDVIDYVKKHWKS